MARKKNKEDWLIIPEIHSEFNDKDVEEIIEAKAKELIGNDAIGTNTVSFMLLSGNFFDTKGYTYSAIRDWRGVVRPDQTSRTPILEATFACLSVYLSSLVSFQCDFLFAHEEIKKILLENEREDLWIIIDEKLPFVSLPPKEMYPDFLQSPISPYYTIEADADLSLGELYPSVYLSNVVKSLKSRFFAFYMYEASTAFAYFNVLPQSAKFGFEHEVKEFEGEPTAENIINYVNEAETMKELFVGLIQAHNAGLLEQYLIPDYESLLNNLLEITPIDEGED